MILDKIANYLDETSVAQLRECDEFLRIKLAKIDEAITKAARKNEEALCNAAQKIRDYTLFKRYNGFLAFHGNSALAGKVDYYWNFRFCECQKDFLSFDSYMEYKRNYGIEIKFEKYSLDRNYDLAFTLYDMFHDLEILRTDGVRILFDDPETKCHEYFYDEEEYDYYILPIFRGAHYLMKIGLYDRARERIALLKRFQRESPRMCQGDRRIAQKIAPMTDFEEHIIEALTSTDGEVARRWAAQAILDVFRAVVENYRDDSADVFFCDDLNLALCVAIAFDFDRDWARECCLALLNGLDTSEFHQAFFKAVELGGWMRTPEEMGALPIERVKELGFKNWP